MLKNTLTIWVLLLISFIFQGAAFAQSPYDENVLLDKQQAEYSSRLGRIDRISNIYGRYILIRDTYYHGTNGVRTMSEKWLTEAKSWTQKWYELILVVNNAPNLNSAKLRDDIHKILDDQRMKWAELKSLSVSIQHRTEDGRAELEKLTLMPDDSIVGFEKQMRFINAKIKGIKDAFTAGNISVDPAQQQEWESLVQKTDEAVTCKLRMSLTKYPQLDQALARVQQAFRAERELEPLAVQVYQKYNQLRDYVLRKMVFHGELALDDLKTSVKVALDAIDASTIDPMFKDDVRKTVVNYQNTSENLFRDATAPFTKAELVAIYATTNDKILAARCRDIDDRKNVNCELLKTLVVFRSTDILKMNDEQLRFFEYQFDKVKGGPISGVKP